MKPWTTVDAQFVQENPHLHTKCAFQQVMLACYMCDISLADSTMAALRTSAAIFQTPLRYGQKFVQQSDDQSGADNRTSLSPVHCMKW